MFLLEDIDYLKNKSQGMKIPLLVVSQDCPRVSQYIISYYYDPCCPTGWKLSSY